ncbi:Mur ligase family protein [Methanopyrus sp.]
MSVADLPFDSVAIIGLGVEGRTCAARLAELGLKVYASDIREDVDVSSLEKLPNVEVETGRHDLDRIRECDAVYFSPSIPNDAKIVRRVSDIGVPPLENLLTWPDSSKFIVVSGTNGKTTTVYMIDHLLDKLGIDREIGGNAGGGFDGYATLYVRAELARPEVVVCEACDMTLDYFSDRAPRYDIAVFLNLGSDHLDYHGSIERYAARAARFCDRAQETAIVKCGGEERRVVERMESAPKCYDKLDVDIDIPLRGEFYELDAKAALLTVAEITGEPPEELAPLLSDFTGVPGRIREYRLGEGRLVVGKTDNVSALEAVMRDYGPLDVVFWGTPRPGEDYRIEGIGRILREAGVERAYVFPGLSEETVDDVIEELSNSGIEASPIESSEVASRALELARRGQAVGILGNGQKVITSIQRDIERTVRFLTAGSERSQG